MLRLEACIRHFTLEDGIVVSRTTYQWLASYSRSVGAKASVPVVMPLGVEVNRQSCQVGHVKFAMLLQLSVLFSLFLFVFKSKV